MGPPVGNHESVEFEVRRARDGDAEAVGGLLEQLSYQHDAGVGDRLASWIEDPRGEVFVADDGERLLGAVAVYFTPRFERDGRWAQIVALVTDDRARGRNVVRSLMHRAESAAIDAGCDMLALMSSRERTGAHAFYQRLGYRDRCEDHAQFVRPLR